MAAGGSVVLLLLASLLPADHRAVRVRAEATAALVAARQALVEHMANVTAARDRYAHPAHVPQSWRDLRATEARLAGGRRKSSKWLAQQFPGDEIAALAYRQWTFPGCHGQGHVPGRRVYANASGDVLRAVQMCGARCQQGCFHGVGGAHVQAVLKHAVNDPAGSLRARLAAAARAIVHFVQMPEVAAVALALPGDAAHVTGHGLVQSGVFADLPSALAYCTQWLAPLSHTPRAFAHFCSGGAVMETQLRSKRALGHSPASVVRFCHGPELPDASRASCFYYGLRRAYVDCKDCASPRSCVALDDAWRACKQGPRTRRTGGGARVAEQLARLCSERVPAAAGGERAAPARAEAAASCWYGLGSASTYTTASTGREGYPQLCALAPLAGGLRLACIDGMAFRASKYWPQALERTCAALGDGADVALCTAVGQAGMYNTHAKEDTLFPLLARSLVEDPSAPPPMPRLCASHPAGASCEAYSASSSSIAMAMGHGHGA